MNTAEQIQAEVPKEKWRRGASNLAPKKKKKKQKNVQPSGGGPVHHTGCPRGQQVAPHSTPGASDSAPNLHGLRTVQTSGGVSQYCPHCPQEAMVLQRRALTG